MRAFTRGWKAAYSFAMAGLLAFSGTSSAATVELRDGTVIHGEVQSLQDGVYTIATDSLGTIRVRKQEIGSIDESGKPAGAAGAPSSADGSSLGAGALDAAKSRIMQDPQLLAMVLALQTDPDVQAVLADPEVTKAMAAGDYASLMDNPKIITLMQSEKIRAIIDGLR
jgi:hypothetical protein